MSRPGCRCHWSAAPLLAAAIALVLSRPADAQHYDEVPVRVDAKQANAISGRIAVILRDAQQIGAEQQKDLDNYFVGYLYSSMTSTDPVELGKLQDKRQQLFQRYLNAAKSAPARQHVVASTLKVMTALLKGNYHPAVRYNAALILGQLESEPGKSLPAATEALLAALQNDKFTDSKGRTVEVPTAVKVGALVALQRHAQRGLDPKYAEPVTKAALAVAVREELPEDVSATVYGWVRRQALQLLAVQYAEGLTPEVHQAFVQVIADDSNDLDDRCGAAELLTAAMYQGKQLDADAMAQALGKLARDIFKLEAEEAKDYLDQFTAEGGAMPAPSSFGGGGYGGGGGGGIGRPGGYGGGYGGGGFDGGFDALEEQGPKYKKRRMMDRAKAIVAAAQAVQAGSDDDLKGRLQQLAGAISAAIEVAANASETEDVSVADAVEKLAKNVNKMVTAWAPAAAPAEDAAAAEAAPANDIPAAAEPAVPAAG